MKDENVKVGTHEAACYEDMSITMALQTERDTVKVANAMLAAKRKPRGISLCPDCWCFLRTPYNSFDTHNTCRCTRGALSQRMAGTRTPMQEFMKACNPEGVTTSRTATALPYEKFKQTPEIPTVRELKKLADAALQEMVREVPVANKGFLTTKPALAKGLEKYSEDLIREMKAVGAATAPIYIDTPAPLQTKPYPYIDINVPKPTAQVETQKPATQSPDVPLYAYHSRNCYPGRIRPRCGDVVEWNGMTLRIISIEYTHSLQDPGTCWCFVVSLDANSGDACEVSPQQLTLKVC